MSKVKILDSILANQIAAGEVVERPYSVVKELVENSIDAKADDITVIISQGGQSNIEVIDNGVGMTKDDALVAVERFGTSKVQNIEDLDNIVTHGFRGEALPSIASVSKFKLSTRTAEHEAGTEIEIIGGKLVNITEKAIPVGTRIEVQQLFFNVPARRKFLRSDKTEAGMIKLLLEDFAVSYPYLKLKLIVDGNQQLNLGAIGSRGVTAEQDFAGRVRQLGFKEKDFFLIDSSKLPQQNFIQVEGVLCEPINAVSGGTKLRLIVNGRSVRDKVIFKAVKDGYGNLIKPNKYPEGVIKLTIPTQDVDVNVHPQKTEIRFRTPELIYTSILRVVSKALSTRQPDYYAPELTTPQLNRGNSFSRHYQSPEKVVFIPPRTGEQINNDRDSVYVGTGMLAEKLERVKLTETVPPPEKHLKPLHEPFFSHFANPVVNIVPEQAVKQNNFYQHLRYVGQVLGCFLLLEGQDNLVVLDMHAAHERVTYYKLRKLIEDNNPQIQNFLIPETFELNDGEVENYKAALPILEKFGFITDLEIKGEDSVLHIKGLPVILEKFSISELFKDLLSLPHWSDWAVYVDKYIDEVIARIACHASVRSGQILAKEEVSSLLRLIDEIEVSAFCPHGRPIAKVFSKKELENTFGRIQN